MYWCNSPCNSKHSLIPVNANLDSGCRHLTKFSCYTNNIHSEAELTALEEPDSPRRPGTGSRPGSGLPATGVRGGVLLSSSSWG
eukprot:1176127-Prorocentrum_minimum.AAC.2